MHLRIPTYLPTFSHSRGALALQTHALSHNPAQTPMPNKEIFASGLATALRAFYLCSFLTLRIYSHQLVKSISVRRGSISNTNDITEEKHKRMLLNSNSSVKSPCTWYNYRQLARPLSC